MCDRGFTFINAIGYCFQASCMPLFFAVTVGLYLCSNAGPVCDCSAPKIHEVLVRKDFAGFSQKISVKIQAEKNLEIIEVPQYNTVDKSDVMHDFNSKLTMFRFPEKKVCYLAPLLPQVPAPGVLENGFQLAKATGSSVNLELSYPTSRTWNVIRRAMDDRSFLTEDMAMFCAKFPIYRVEEAAGGGQQTVKPGATGAVKNEVHREGCVDPAPICHLTCIQCIPVAVTIDVSTQQACEAQSPTCTLAQLNQDIVHCCPVCCPGSLPTSEVSG
ncbi:PREDICTED: uncharacterized protein LOC109480208 [Branchiostoma belcheri]|uniref:Uncharacterized protein LOC109480208 n=1 Tax=Branchiostoma belcheri TaxID=7741 RepID=A0A6P5A844_BRABE|nr:PREDICTED: uncharacterized protein LOC109480208 [Branchiostoma belcheri]